MPPDDYKAVTSGALKLKGVNSTSKISKSHKKKKPKATQEANPTTLKQPGKNTVMETENGLEADGGVDCETGQEVKGLGGEDEVEGEMALRRLGKTEAELRHEEQRRRRVCLLSPSADQLVGVIFQELNN